MKVWQQSVDEVRQRFATDLHEGLTPDEARQRLEKYGPNRLPEQRRISLLSILFNQFSSLIVWILIGALIISALFGEWIDAVSIGAIVILNALIGFFQEYSAESSLMALRQLVTPMTKVIRGGTTFIIPSADLVPGDLVLLESGDSVPADGRVIESLQLSMQEAALTGESVPVVKITDKLTKKELMVGDRTNMAFAGTTVVKGKGTLIITHTGINTELGKIATTLQTLPEEKPHFAIQIERVGRYLIAGCFVIIFLVFFLGVLRGNALLDMIFTSLSLAVAAIPEGLPAVITVALAIGVRRMVKRKALIRRLSSVGTLGSVTVICTDKTGTLTQNEMVVKSICIDGSCISVTGVGYTPEGEFFDNKEQIVPQENSDLMLALKIGTLCNGANAYEEKGKWLIAGDPTEGALLIAARKAGLKKNELEKRFPLVTEFPFDSERKRMGMLREDQGQKILFVKGLPDVILSLCTMTVSNGEVRPLSKEKRENALALNSHLATQGLRVLAVAYRLVDDSEVVDATLEHSLIFVGLTAMMDPPRPEAKGAIEKCKKAGIKSIMITGDQKETALAIANELGLLTKTSKGIDGIELDRLDDKELERSIATFSVYARVTPLHKLRVIRAWQEHGEIVAMTGDGVNDAPAIRAADVGIAMGVMGTEVAKEASDMVILDDNFASIVNAIEEGRGIYDSLLKFVNYLLSSNISELSIIFMGTLVGFTDPTGQAYLSLLPIQLLWINLITDGLPAMALAVDPFDPKIMDRPPRHPSKPIISYSFALELLFAGFVIALGALIACHIGLRTSAQLGHTMTVTTLVVLEFMRVQIVRARYAVGFFSNPWLIASLVGSLILQLCIIYIPGLQMIFRTTSLGMYEWIVIVIVMMGVWGVTSLGQRIFRVLSP